MLLRGRHLKTKSMSDLFWIIQEKKKKRIEHKNLTLKPSNHNKSIWRKSFVISF